MPEHISTKTTGLKHFKNSFIYSMQGLKSALQNETAFRQECFIACFLVPAAFWLGDNNLEIIALIATVFLVLIVELLNSAIEAVVDRIGSEKHELSGRAKDVGSAAVFMALVLTGLTWLLIVIPKLTNLLTN